MEKLTDKETIKQHLLTKRWAEQTAKAYGMDLLDVQDHQIISFLAQTQVRNNSVLVDIINCDSCNIEITTFANVNREKLCRECA